MPEYTLTITIPSAGNRKINYTLNLIGTHERYPEDFFRVQENRNHLSQTIQQQSARQLDKNQLNRIISDWTRDIKEGYRNTGITLDLAPDTLTSPAVFSTVTQVHPNPVTFNPPIAIPKPPIKPPSTNPQPIPELPHPNPPLGKERELNQQAFPPVTSTAKPPLTPPDLRGVGGDFSGINTPTPMNKTSTPPPPPCAPPPPEEEKTPPPDTWKAGNKYDDF